jgi:hypothetical protein
MISTYTKYSPWEKMAQICYIQRFFSKLPDYNDKFEKVTKTMKDFFFLLSYLICTQIWQNHFMVITISVTSQFLKKRTLCPLGRVGGKKKNRQIKGVSVWPRVRSVGRVGQQVS